jgi:hypothetical protein
VDGRALRPRAAHGLGYRIGVLTTIGSALLLAGLGVALWLNPAIFRQTGGDGVEAPSSDRAQLVARVAMAEASLRSGELRVTRLYDTKAGSSTVLRYDLGDGQQEQRLQRITTYYTSRKAQTVEWLTRGPESWRRQPDGGWEPQPPHEPIDVGAELRAFLPRAETYDGVELPREAGYAVLQWHDPERNADLTLLIDPADGVPHELRQTLLETGERLVITYTIWGEPVDIPAPPS